MAIEATTSATTVPPSATKDNRIPFHVRLIDSDLWSKFQENGNEMIITRCGRCLFPLLKVEIIPFEDVKSAYDVRLNLLLMGGERWKYRNNRWICLPQHQHQQQQQQHQSYKLALPIKKDTFHAKKKFIASFEGVKLSNVETTKKMTFLVQSFKKYQLSLTITDKNQQDIEEEFNLPLTEFIAVTHYQNSLITSLKKYHNPHAKGTIKQRSSPISWDSISYIDVEGDSGAFSENDLTENEPLMEVEDVDAAFILERIKKRKF